MTYAPTGNSRSNQNLEDSRLIDLCETGTTSKKAVQYLYFVNVNTQFRLVLSSNTTTSNIFGEERSIIPARAIKFVILVAYRIDVMSITVQNSGF